MKESNGVLGMIKFAASRSGSKFVIGREGWKGMVVYHSVCLVKRFAMCLGVVAIFVAECYGCV